MEIQSIKQSHISILIFSVSQEQQRLSVKRQELREELEKVEREFNDNQSLLDELGAAKLSSIRFSTGGPPYLGGGIAELPLYEGNGSEYSPSMNYWEKVKYILKRESRALSALEIIETIFLMEPELGGATEDIKKTVKNNVFATLTNKRKLGELRRFLQNGINKYGFNDWFSGPRDIREEYRSR